MIKSGCMPIFLMMISLMPLASSVTSPCSSLTAISGSSWVLVTWTVHCDVEQTPDLVNYYHLVLTDKTADIYHQDNKPYCSEYECSFLVDPLRSCIDYTVNLTLIFYNSTEYTYDSSEVTTMEETPSQPRGLTASAVNSTALSLNWITPSIGEFCVDHYEVCWTDTTKDNCKTTTQLEEILAGLEPCKEYKVIVSPMTSNGTRGPSTTTAVTTDDEDPGSPEDVIIDDRGSDYISLAWSRTSLNPQCTRGVGAMCVEASLLPSNSNNIYSRRNQSMDNGEKVRTEFDTIENLEVCTLYTCWVQYPMSDGTNWIASEQVTHHTWVKGVKISEPRDISHTSFTDKIQVSWTAPNQAARCVDSYLITWEDEDEETKDTEVNSNIYSYTIPNLLPCVSYSIQIAGHSKVWDQDKLGETASLLARTLNTAPGSVLDLSQVEDQTTKESVTLTWRPPSSNPQCVDHYDYRVSGGPFQDNCYPPRQDGDVYHVICISCLVCSQTYSVQVWAVEIEGKTSQAANIDHVQTLDC